MGSKMGNQDRNEEAGESSEVDKYIRRDRLTRCL